MNLIVERHEPVPLKTILTPDVVTVSPDTPVLSVLSLMHKRKISSVVAVDDQQRPVGIVTEQDAIRLLADRAALTNKQMSEVMTSKPVTVLPHVGYTTAYQVMADKGVRHLIVVDETDKLIGLVSEGDFLHHMGMEYLIEDQPVSTAMTKGVVTLNKGQSLITALTQMSKARISSVVIMQDELPLGILTERDMVRLAQQEIDPEQTPLSAVMTEPLITVFPQTPLRDAAEIMQKESIRRLAVVNQKGDLKGIVTRHDIARAVQSAYIDHLQETLLRKEQHLQATERRLRELEQKGFYQNLLEQVSDAIFIIDAENGRVLDANQQASQNLGYNHDDLIGIPVTDFIGRVSSASDWKANYLSQLKVHASLVKETVFRGRDGEIFPVEVKASLVNYSGRAYLVAIARDLSERQNVIAQLKESEQRFQSLFENAPLAYQSLSAEGEILFVNEAWLTLLGRERDEVIGHSITEFLTAASIEKLQIHLPAFISMGRVDGPIFELKTKSGELRLVEVNGRISLDHISGDICTHCILMDVTERLHSEQELKESEERFRILYQKSPLPMAYVSFDGNLLSLNDEFSRAYGYRAEDIPDLAQWEKQAFPDDVVSKELHTQWFDSIRQAVISDGRIVSQKMQIATREGDLRTVNASGMTTDQGFLAIVEDITEQEKVAQALKENAETYFGIITTSLDGFWVVNNEGYLVDVNEAYSRMSGYSRDELLQMAINDLDAMETPEVTRNRIAKLRESGGQRFTTRHTRKDGSIYDVEVNVTYWQEGGGRFFCFLRDITRRKENEDKLRQAAVVFSSTNEGVVVTSPDGVIQLVNNSFCDLTGYQRDDVLGKPVSLLQSGRHNKQFYQQMWQSIDTSGSWQGEIWNRRKDGSTYPELLSISSVKNEHQEITHYVGVFADISRLKESEEKLAFLAHHDMLTGLPNRLMLQARLEQALATAKRQGKQLALLLMDLDRFKDVNDSFGHAAGDELLLQVSRVLKERLRDADVVCRMGGDEFAILLDNIHREEDAGKVANEIINDLSRSWKLKNGIEVTIGATVGISLFPVPYASPETLLQHADAALYRAKAEGRGRFNYFSEELTQEARNRLELEARLRRALLNQELQVYLQPQIDLKTDEIVGAEALLRWVDPDRGMISPAEFIPVAEHTGLIDEIGLYVLRATCAQGRTWLDQGLKPVTLAVNISPIQLRHGELDKQVEQILTETGFSADLLELEITESALMSREQESIELLHRLRELGVKLAIDDFGTGYSSLAYLKKLPLDVLKIDKSFVDEIPHNRDDVAISTTIISMAHNLGLEVLAEGVETIAQLQFMQQHSCDRYQGYYRSPAVPAAEFEELLLLKS